jgi:integral membrane sensor domain MASE1
LAIAAILLRGYRVAAAIFIGAFLVNQLTAGSILTSLAIASGNTLEAVVAVYLLTLWGKGEQIFDTPNGVIKFALISLAATLASATIGSLHQLWFSGQKLNQHRSRYLKSREQHYLMLPRWRLG